MPLFSAGAEYALHTVLNIERAAGAGPPSARELATFQKLPLAFTRRLLTQLEKGGVLRGAEGVRGGWQLARPAAEITVADIVDAVHGPSVLFECRNIRARCALWPDDKPPRSASSGVCAIEAVMLRAEAAMRRELQATTVAELAEQVEAKTAGRGGAAVAVWFAERYRGRSTPEPVDRSSPAATPKRTATATRTTTTKRTDDTQGSKGHG